MTNKFLSETFSLEGKTALVTGASSGLGAHFSRVLQQAGCQLALAARRIDRLQDMATDMNRSGCQAAAYQMDVCDTKNVRQVVQQVRKDFGAIDILVNNAGVAEPQKFLDMTEDAWQNVLDVNLTGVWRVGQTVAKEMVKQESGGRIVNISSVLGLAVQYQQANYSAAKAAVVQLTKSMALELGRKSVMVNAIAPGYFISEINQDFLHSDRGRQYVDKLYPGRAGELRELNGALLLLVSDAGSYINGTCITVDGGSMLTGF